MVRDRPGRLTSSGPILRVPKNRNPWARDSPLDCKTPHIRVIVSKGRAPRFRVRVLKIGLP